MQKTFCLIITLVLFGNAIGFSQVRASSQEQLQQAEDLSYQENFSEALVLLEHLLESSTNQEQQSVFYTQVLSEWIKVYTALGNAKAALPALKKAQTTIESPFDTQNSLLARYKNLEGEIWKGSTDALGLQIAVGYFKEAESLIEKTANRDEALYERILLNIVDADILLGDFDDAESYIQKSLRRVQEQSENPLDIIPFAVPYVRILELKGMYSEALDMLTTIKSILEANPSHTYYNQYYFTVTDQFTGLYMSTGDTKNAIASLNSQIALIEELAGKETQIYQESLITLAKLYLDQQDYEKAVSLYIESNAGLLRQIEKTFRFTGERQKRKYLQSLSENFNEILSLSNELKQEHPELIASALNTILTVKGLVLESSREVIRSLEDSKDSGIKNQIKLFKTYNDSIARLQELPYGSYTFVIQDLEKERDAIEVALNRLYFEGKTKTSDFVKDWKAIQHQLNDTEIAIEFARYPVLGEKINETKDEQYVAFLIKKGWANPKLIPVFRLQEFNALFDSKPQELFVSRGSRAIAKDIKALNYELVYDLILGDIAPFLEGVNHIYYAPDGILHQVPFAALGKRNDSTLLKKYDLTLLNKTSDIKKTKGLRTIESAVLYGGIDYQYPLNSEKAGSYVYVDSKTNTEFKYTKNEELVVSEWNPLPGTLTEVDSITKILKTAVSNFKTLAGQEATETSIKNLTGNSPELIHLATHGFFYNRAQPRVVRQELHNNPYLYSDNKLMHSGLLFAGANFSWEYGSNPYEDENGILTALEISNLDLSNTKIAILSACETGLGFIEGSEGIYGLKRAFKMAGVDVLILSLWQVPDKETAEFMQLFYTYWISEKATVHQAFRKAQEQMSTTYKKDTYKWAAFVLIE